MKVNIVNLSKRVQNDEDIVYDETAEMSSFHPIPDCQQQEVEAIQQQLHVCDQTQRMPWPTVDSDQLN